MASPFSSRDHYAVAPGRCYCGRSYNVNPAGEPVSAEIAAYRLDVHILGPELAGQIHADRLAATAAIHAKAKQMSAGGDESDG